MDSTLYILRRTLHEIPPSLLSPTNSEVNVIFLERALSDPRHLIESGHLTGSRHAMTYEDLIEKVFASERIIVI